jgi:hypothetical protein
MMSGLQEFTPEQLERIESAVNSVLASTNDPRTPGAVVKDILRNQDLTNARSGLIIRVKKSSPVGFLRLPAEIRNKIYRYCLVVGEVYPRAKSEEDDRLSNRSNFQKAQTQVFEVCRQIFTEATPIYFAENKFILSDSKLPWSPSTEDLNSRPMSRAAHQNLRSLSVTFDRKDDDILHKRCRSWVSGIRDLEKWQDLGHLLRYLDIQLLEVSLKGCYCAVRDNRLTIRTIHHLLKGIRSFPRVVLGGLLDESEVTTARDFIDMMCHYSGGDGLDWRPKYEDEDPDDEFRISFQVTERAKMS